MATPVEQTDDPDVPSWMREDPSTNFSTNKNDVESPGQDTAATEESGGGTATATTTNGTARAADGSNITSAAKAAADKTWGEYFRDSFKRDGRLLLITLAILICMNIPYIKWILYPFTIFSTWIHELCHGMAAVLAGGSIKKLVIYPDATGLAYTSVPVQRRGFVISAGYQGTAAVGCLLLLFRRTKRGPRAGTMSIATMMILSCLLWIRNAFGFVIVFLLGAILAGVAIKLPSVHMRNVYVGLAVTCALNAITSVRNLFGANQTINGEPSSTDAHSMAELKGGTATAWAVLWLILALVLTVLGILFAVPGPDEVADFRCCGVCQDLGLFKCCNYPGQRLAGRAKKKWNDSRTPS